jgi:ABC-type transporter Mla subunit MlaD
MTSIKGATDQLPATMMAIRAATADLPATMMSVKEAADTANDSSTEALNLTGSAISLVDDLRAKIDDVIPKAGNTVAKLGTTADAASDTFTRLGKTSDAASETFIRLGKTADAGTALMSSAEMKAAIGNLGALEATLNTTTAHFDQKFMAPWDHAHPVRHYIGLTGKTILSVTGLGATLVRDTK